MAKGVYQSNGKNVAAYWGQGENQGSLASYCKEANVGIMILSFLNNFGAEHASYNFGSACWEKECPQIEKDIKTCQDMGIKVLLSLGGDSRLGDYMVKSDEDGKAAAKIIYNLFNPNGDPSYTRPFGDATIDGFDFDIEKDISSGLGALAAELRSLWGSKLLISATPQCPFPDSGVNELLRNEDAKVDYAFVQFYNNPGCAVKLKGFTDSWNTWSDFVQNDSGNHKMKIFVGVCTSCDSEYIVDLKELEEVTQSQRESSVFGGFTLWQVSSGETLVTGKTNYMQGLYNIIGGKSLRQKQESVTTTISSFPSSPTNGTIRKLLKRKPVVLEP